MITCHVCRRPWADHAPDCRIRADLERMRKVHDRLLAEDRDPQLRQMMGRYLDRFGDLSCQHRRGMPTQADCGRCGHIDVCVILPPGIRKGGGQPAT